MPDYGIRVVVQPDQAVAGVARVERSLDSLDKKANRTRDNLQRAFREPATAIDDFVVRTIRAQRAAEEVYTVGKNARGEFVDSFGALGDGADKAGGSIVGLGGALKAVGFAVAAKQVYDLADAFGNIQNKLAVVTDGSEELRATTDKLYDVAQRTRSSFESTVSLYSRLAVSSKELGLSQRELVQFTESLNKTVILSGASAAEAEAAIVQLSQGLASGALRGDELRSVLEQLPAVADVIADSLGVTRGQLREMGAEGKITATTVINAFAEAREEIDERFSKTTATVGQTFTQLKNTLIRFGGELGNAIAPAFAEIAGVVQRVASALSPLIGAVGQIVSLASKLALAPLVAQIEMAVDAIGPLIDVVVGLADAILGLANAVSDFLSSTDAYLVEAEEFERANVDVSDSLRGFEQQVADMTNQLSLMAPAARAAAEATKEFERAQAGVQRSLAAARAGMFAGNAIALSKQVAETARLRDVTRDYTGEVFGQRKALAEYEKAQRDVNDAVQQGWISEEYATELLARKREAMAELIDPLGAIQASLREETMLLGLNARERAVVTELIAIENRLRAQGVDLSNEEIENLRAQIETRNKAERRADARGKASQEIEKQRKEIQALVAAAFPAQKALADLADAERILEQGVAKGRISRELATQTLDRYRASLQDQIEPVRALLGEMEEELHLARLSNTEREWAIRLRGLEDAARREGRALTDEELDLARRLFDETRRAEKAKETAAKTDERLRGAERDRFEERLAELRTLRTSLNELERPLTLGQGLTGGLQDVMTSLFDVANAAQDAVAGAFKTAEDALVSLVTTGKADFKSLVDSMLADLARLLLRQGLLGLASEFFGFGSGGGSIVGPLGAGARIPGFANGGTYTVPGSGPPDSSLFMARVTPGERIDFTPPGRQSAASAPVVVPAPTVQVSNVVDPRAALSVLRSPAGRRVLKNVIQEEGPQIRALLRVR